MQGRGVAEKIEGDAGEGKEDKMRGGGVLLREKFEGGMPERVKKMKCGGGGVGG